MRHTPPAFPVGLYGMLLFALCWLTLPRVFAPLERWLLGATCVLPRVVAAWSGSPVHASTRGADRSARERAAELRTRAREADVAGTRSLLSVVYEPVHCVVREVVPDTAGRGGGGGPGAVRLDHTYAELADCAELVTKGDALLGFLGRPGSGLAAEHGPNDCATVVLLNHRSARPVGAVLEQPDGGRLRLVVRGAAAIDPAPLRADLWDDPYRAARLEQSGHPVRTLLPFGDQQVPAGLLVGRTRIWGYEDRQGDETLTIGVFLVPPIEPRALSYVVLWRARPSGDVAPAPSPVRRERRLPAVVRDLPGARSGRHLLQAEGFVPDGAAVVQGGQFLGTARGLAFGSGLVTAFGASRHAWSLILLPDDPNERPREIEAEVEWCLDNKAWLHRRPDQFDGSHERLPPGYLFTGSNGPHCPVGLAIGSAEPHPERRDLLVVTMPSLTGARAAEVVIGGGT